jgi:hydroxymethylbilane synthase
MKDVETIRAGIFRIAAMLPRADVRDRLIGAESIAALPQGAKVGTSSPRRVAQLKALRPDLITESIRGNVATRLSKVANGEFDATLLAAAGLDRLGQSDIGVAISASEMLPAASQGAIGIDCLADRTEIAALLAPINHRPTFDCVTAERAFLEALGGTCHSPVAAQAAWEGSALLLKGEILREDGRERQSGSIACSVGDSAAPAQLARQLLDAASPELRALFEG